MEKGASGRRPRRLRVALFALGSVFTLAGALVLALPVQAWEGAVLGHNVNCDQGVVYFTGTNFGQGTHGRIHLEYPPSEEEFFINWNYDAEKGGTQVIASMSINTMIKQAGTQPPFMVWDSLEEDDQIMDDWDLQPCGGVSPTPTPPRSPTPTPSGGVSPTATPVTPTPSGGVSPTASPVTPTPSGGVSPTSTPPTTPTPFGSVLPTQLQGSPGPTGGVLAESIGLPNTGVPRSTVMALAGTLIAIGLMLLALSALVWRRPVTGRL